MLVNRHLAHAIPADGYGSTSVFRDIDRRASETLGALIGLAAANAVRFLRNLHSKSATLFISAPEPTLSANLHYPRAFLSVGRN